MRTSFLFAFSVGVLGVICGGALAEKLDLPPEGLARVGTHVVVGKVLAIYEWEETQGDWRTTRYVAEIQAAVCEKGEGIRKGDLVYARYWHREWAGKGDPPPATFGHRGLPSVGQVLRVYLSRNAYDGFGDTRDGGFNVVGANGFQPLPRD